MIECPSTKAFQCSRDTCTLSTLIFYIAHSTRSRTKDTLDTSAACRALARCIVSLTVNSSHAARRTRFGNHLQDSLHQGERFLSLAFLHVTRHSSDKFRDTSRASISKSRARISRGRLSIFQDIPDTRDRVLSYARGTRERGRATIAETQILGIGVTSR